jgi:hypothetical protein
VLLDRDTGQDQHRDETARHQLTQSPGRHGRRRIGPLAEARGDETAPAVGPHLDGLATT